MNAIVYQGSSWSYFCRLLKKNQCSWRRKAIKVLMPLAFHGNGCPAAQSAGSTHCVCAGSSTKRCVSALGLLLHVIYPVQVSSNHNCTCLWPLVTLAPLGIVGPCYWYGHKVWPLIGDPSSLLWGREGIFAPVELCFQHQGSFIRNASQEGQHTWVLPPCEQWSPQFSPPSNKE